MIANCRLPIQNIADFRLPIADWFCLDGAAVIETLYVAKRQSTIGNWKSAMF